MAVIPSPTSMFPEALQMIDELMGKMDNEATIEMNDKQEIEQFNPQPGDVVQLKSGGYQMTVLSIQQSDKTILQGSSVVTPGTIVSCCWHLEDGEPIERAYLSVMLEPATEDDDE